jgi:hypothetical protein
MREKKVLEAAVMYEDRGDNGKLSEPTITSGADQSAAGDGLIAAISRGKARAVFVPRGFTPTVGGACILVASLLSCGHLS